MKLPNEHVREALDELGGVATPKQITDQLLKRNADYSWNHPNAQVRSVLHHHCVGNVMAKGKTDAGLWFEKINDGSNRYRLRQRVTSGLLSNGDHNAGFGEGDKKARDREEYERNPKLVLKFKRNPANHTCCVCKTNFHHRYGEIGQGFIEAHHIHHLAHSEPGRISTLADLAALCSNCHSMVHRKIPETGEYPTIAELKKLYQSLDR